MINTTKIVFDKDIKLSEVNFNLDNLNFYLLQNKLISLDEYNLLQQRNSYRINIGWVFSVYYKKERLKKLNDINIIDRINDNNYISLLIENYMDDVKDLNIEIPTYLFFNYFLNQ